MIRPFLSYALTAIILLSQTGLPLHMHYCKGILESVSVFISAACGDHKEVSDLPACCQKTMATHCQKDENCCDDEVAVLLQDFDSLIPHFDQWGQAVPNEYSVDFPIMASIEDHSPKYATHLSADSGPPIYILFHSLIYYA